jgi:two-component system, LytTR family, response regulator
MIKALLIDDEVRATDSLQLMIERFVPEIDQVWVCNDARNAAGMIHSLQPDLLFLDIRMPHITGFDVLNALPNKHFKVIFTTAYDEYAIKAVRFSAFDYLLKPVDAKELIDAIKRFLQEKEDPAQQYEMVKNISINMELQHNRQFRLALPTKEGVHFLMPDEIIRCEAIGNYTRFYIVNNRQYTSSKNLGEYEELLTPFYFIRTHKSHLINKKFISFIDHDSFVILQDSTRVEISRRRKNEVMAALRSH